MDGFWDTPHMNIDDLLRIAMERRASDLHLKVGNYPHLRIDGELTPLTDQPRVSAEDMLNMAFSMMSARQKQKFKETTEIDMAYGVAGLGRFRVSTARERRTGAARHSHQDTSS
jgi:twitching motility protein PilT